MFCLKKKYFYYFKEFSRCFRDIFKKFSRRFRDVFKTFSRRFQISNTFVAYVLTFQTTPLALKSVKKYATQKHLNVWNSVKSSRLALFIGHSNRDHATSSKRGRSEHFTTSLSKADLDRLLYKALQAPSLGGGCMIPITFPYCFNIYKRDFVNSDL